MPLENLVIKSGNTDELTRHDGVSNDNEIRYNEDTQGIITGKNPELWSEREETAILPGSSQEIIVGVASGQYNSVKNAVDAITDSSISKPYVVRVAPGVYTEDPFSIPAYVEIVGENVTLQPSDNDNDFVNASGTRAQLSGINITGPTNADAVILSGDTSQYRNGSIIGPCVCGIRSSGTSVVVLNASIQGCTTGYNISGGTGFLVTANIVSCTTAIDLSGAALLLGNSISCLLNTIDLKTSHANAEVELTGARIQSDKLSITDWANVKLDIISNQEADEAKIIIQELQVGVPEKGYESVFGQGDSYVRGMLVYTYDGADYVDVSEAARSASSSTFTYPNLLVNSAIYISADLINGGDYLQPQGIKALIQTALVPGSGKIVAEYYNGAWTEFNTMSTESSGQYFPFADKIFERAGHEQIRYNYQIVNDWVKNDDPGTLTNRFWVRFRIDTAAITTAPVFEQFKLHTSRSEINADGWHEYFGYARPLGRMPWEVGAFLRGSTNPGDQSVFLSQNLDIGGANNNFANNITARITWKTTLPLDCDTSCPIVFQGSVITSDASAGNIRWTIRWGYNTDGDPGPYLTSGASPAISPNEQSFTDDFPAPVAAETSKWYSTDLDISGIIARRENGFPDTIWVSIERNGSADTHTGNVTLVAVAGFYTRWSDGGHI